MSKIEDVLSQEELFIYKWKMNMLGGFKSSLMHTITLADSSNLACLEKGFPMEVSAYKCFAYRWGWWEGVEKKMVKWKQAEEAR